MLDIRVYPDPLLRETSQPVEVIDDEIRSLAREMIETMYAAKGVGLAASQVGVLKRIVVVDMDPEKLDPRVLVNPQIIELSPEKETAPEGCLSLPNIEARVRRAAQAVVQAQDLSGELIQYTGSGIMARALQHEYDHIEGILFIDRVSPTQKFAIRKELAALEERFTPAQ